MSAIQSQVSFATPTSFLETIEQLQTTIDQWTVAQLRQHVHDLVETLGFLRESMPVDSWKTFAQEIQRTGLRNRLLEDPFTGRCASKPRGYAGDAGMLDFIYEHPSIASVLRTTSEFGRNVFNYTCNSGASRAVRNRRDLLSTEIDRVCDARPDARILSVACGHLREGLTSRAVQEHRLDEFVALDADSESLSTVRQDIGGCRVRPVHGSVKTLLKSSAENLGTFDFIYSAGLYDYLSDAVALRLTKALLNRLRPGGRLWISNFVPNTGNRGYMEAVMDWWLIYRDEKDLESLAAQLALDDRASIRTFRESALNIAFLEIRK
jgi:extracellular factor (EF) 3-hydroxypalmitic acid methyl ester biosynthesis protein